MKKITFCQEHNQQKKVKLSQQFRRIEAFVLSNSLLATANHRVIKSSLLCLACLLLFARCENSLGKSGDIPEDVIRITPEELQWKDGPPSLPDGAKAAILSGIPSEDKPFVARLKLPEDYAVPPHLHPVNANITVIYGAFHIGVGKEADHSQGKQLNAGGFHFLPVGVPHYVWTSKETVIQIHAKGPWGITYVNPEDDPRPSTN